MSSIGIKSVHIFLNKYKEIGSEKLYYVCVNTSFKQNICQRIIFIIRQKISCPCNGCFDPAN